MSTPRGLHPGKISIHVQLMDIHSCITASSGILSYSLFLEMPNINNIAYPISMTRISMYLNFEKAKQNMF